MSANQKCCRGGDVRGLCFTGIGDIAKMTDEVRVEVSKCPSTPYAIAYWFWNNHNDDFSTNNYRLIYAVLTKIFKDCDNRNEKWNETMFELCQIANDDIEDENRACKKCIDNTTAKALESGYKGMLTVECKCD